MASEAMNAAKSRVTSAERGVASATQIVKLSEEMLAAAESQLTSAQTEFDEAKKDLKNIEEKFKVINIDIDSDSDEDDDGKEGKGNSPHKRDTDNIENQNQNNGQKSDRRQRRVLGSTGATENNAREVPQSTTGNVARSFQIFAVGPTNKTYTLDVTSLDTIADVKAKIYEKSGAPPEGRFRLVYNGKTLLNGETHSCTTLVDGETLSSYNIQKESTVHVPFKYWASCSEASTDKTVLNSSM